jgi:hypothetical protein
VYKISFIVNLCTVRLNAANQNLGLFKIPSQAFLTEQREKICHAMNTKRDSAYIAAILRAMLKDTHKTGGMNRPAVKTASGPPPPHRE